MVELNTLLIIGLTGFGVGVITTAVMVLLFVIYNNITAVSDKLKDNDDNEGFAIPLSSMMGGIPGRTLSVGDVQAYLAQQRAAGQLAGQPEEVKKAMGGNYI